MTCICLSARGGTSLLLCISYIFDACVPIYLFCSGYGLYVSEERKPSNLKSRLDRILKLLIRFWIILAITCIVGYCMGMQKTYPGTFLNLLLNIFLVKSSYVGAFWFVQTYVLLVLLSGIVFKIIKKSSWIVMIVLTLGLYVMAFAIEYMILGKLSYEPIKLVMNAVMLLLRSQFSFVIGALFVKENMIDKSKLIAGMRENRIILWAIIILTVCVRVKLAHMIFAPFSAIVLIVLLGTYDWGKIGKKVLLFFGKHSTNMWLVHMQFYMIFTPKLVFGSRNVFIIMLTLIVLSVGASYVINLLYDLVMKIVKQFCW